MPTESITTRGLDLKALLWDMDGTLVDTEPLWVECERDLMADFGYAWGDHDAAHCMGGPMERVEIYMQEKSGSRKDPAWFGDRLTTMMLERLSLGTRSILKPGAEELVAEARTAGLAMALVSASRRSIVDAVLAALPFSFDLSISASEVTHSKPHPEGYRKAASMLATDIQQCVVLEDSKVGITSGLASGAMVIGLTNEDHEHVNYRGFIDLQEVSFSRLVDTHRLWITQSIAGERR